MGVLLVEVPGSPTAGKENVMGVSEIPCPLDKIYTYRSTICQPETFLPLSANVTLRLSYFLLPK